jgi:UDP-N-acetylglucosamine--N-acetylmuramyl-(pentapeptide) pyrophosphoryl-undecaprenol N-acetylglucosamine transferase
MTLAELAAAGRGALLVPFPFAADDHQRHNAEAVQREGAAEVVLDEDLDGDAVASIVERLAGDPQRVIRMGRASRGLAIPDATDRIADEVDELLEGGTRHVS